MELAPGVLTVGELEVIEHIGAGGALIDTRQEHLHRAGTIPGARGIPHPEILDHTGTLETDRPTVFFCNGPQCTATPQAVRALLDSGHPGARDPLLPGRDARLDHARPSRRARVSGLTSRKDRAVGNVRSGEAGRSIDQGRLSMHVSKRTAIAMLSTAALAGSAASAVTATGHGDKGRGDHGRQRGATLLATTLAPSVPGDPTLNGVVPGNAPWVLRRGSARLRRDGRLHVDVRGLVIPSPPGDGTPGPVMTVSASLYCGNDTVAVGTTPAAMISRSGDARMDGRFTLPAKCLAPAVLVHPNGNAAAYIAASGFGG